MVFFGQVEKIDLGYLLWTYLWPNSFIYLHLSIIIIIKTENRFIFGQDFIKLKIKKKGEFYNKFESPCRFSAKYFLLSMFV